jgi:hypothetical protein
LDLDESAESVAMYLTAAYLDGESGRKVGQRLHILDLDRRLHGVTPCLQDQRVKTLLRGLYVGDPVGEGRSWYDPLYLELTCAMVDACRSPSIHDRRAHAAQLLRDATGLGTCALARIAWQQIHLTSTQLQITVTTKVGRGQPTSKTHVVPSRPGSRDCPVAALRVLRALQSGPLLFGTSSPATNIVRVGEYLRQQDPLVGAPARKRDAALLLIGYSAGLRTGEARTLRQGDVQAHDRGLAIAIAGRKRMTYLPSALNPAYDPSTVWAQWLETMRGHDRLGDGEWAFPQCSFSRIWTKPIGDQGLNFVVHQRSEQAQMRGRYAWSSLRTGMMRAALRDGHPAFLVASHADLDSLASVQRHEAREALLGGVNVAARLGL